MYCRVIQAGRVQNTLKRDILGLRWACVRGSIAIAKLFLEISVLGNDNEDVHRWP